jgi:hypothetical protein
VNLAKSLKNLQSPWGLETLFDSQASTAQDIDIEYCQQKAYALEVWCDCWSTIVTEYSEIKKVPWKNIYKRRVAPQRFLLSCQLEE